jgi:cell division protein FtsB
MKKITTFIVTMCITSICFAQGKKEVLLMIEAQNTTINSLNQQLSSLTAHQKKLEEQVKELQEQVKDLKTLLAASRESEMINTGWTKRGDFFSGLAVVQDDNTNKYGFIDKTGKLIIPCEWTSAFKFNDHLNGLAAVKDNNGMWGFIDKTGKIVIPCTYKKIDWRGEGMLAVQDDNDKWGVIDPTGKLISPCIWMEVGRFQEEMAAVKDSDMKFGFINK